MQFFIQIMALLLKSQKVCVYFAVLPHVSCLQGGLGVVTGRHFVTVANPGAPWGVSLTPGGSPQKRAVI